jgi:uncharacterized protein (DUF58 family)
MILVDTHIESRTPAHHADVEMCIAMAASLASYSLEADLPVGLAVWSDGFKIVEPQRGKRHRRDLLTLLAQLPLNMNHPAQDLVAAAYDLLDGVASPILISPAAEMPSAAARGRSMLTIRPHTPQAERWFQFDPRIDFAHAMPLTQQVPRAMGFEVANLKAKPISATTG